MAVEIRIPHLGESVTEGVILRWLKRDGDIVQVDEPVLELETDKATLEIPATASGRLEIVEREGAAVRVGTVVARLAEGAPAKAPATEAGPAEPKAAAVGDAAREAGKGGRGAGADVDERDETPPGSRAQDGPRTARPGSTARRVPAEEGAGPSPGRSTGSGGGLSADDLRRHIAETAAQRVEAPDDEPEAAEARPERDEAAARARAPEEVKPAEPRESPAPRAAAPEPQRAPAPEAREDEVERKPMSRLRRRIAERLVEAQRTAAILTTFNEVDLSRLLAARQRHRERFRERHGVDLGLVSLFGRACILALADVPIVNARIEGDDVVYHRHVHLGIAVSTPRGLVVPVVRQAERMRLAELEAAIAERARRARDGKLTPDDLAGGTFTISNGGVFGSLLSTPILNPPQSGILGMHKIEERPVAVDGQVVIRPMMYVALSYDHRLVDGEQAVTFLVRIKERLEDPVRMLLEV